MVEAVDEGVRGEGRGEVEALSVIDADPLQPVELLSGFDALGGDIGAKGVGESGHSGDELLRTSVMFDPGHE